MSTNKKPDEGRNKDAKKSLEETLGIQTSKKLEQLESLVLKLSEDAESSKGKDLAKPEQKMENGGRKKTQPLLKARKSSSDLHSNLEK